MCTEFYEGEVVAETCRRINLEVEADRHDQVTSKRRSIMIIVSTVGSWKDMNCIDKKRSSSEVVVLSHDAEREEK